METMAFSSHPWWSKDTVAVVTGANKGVGYEIVRLLAEQGLTVVLTARDSDRGQAALDALKTDGPKSAWFHQLDVQSPESVESLATWLKSRFGGIDILINNAGIAYASKGAVVDYENAKEIIDTNYFGVKRVTEGLLLLLRPSLAAARIVNVTSGAGLYEFLRSEKLKQTFRDEDKYSQELIDSLATKFLEDVKAGRLDEEGWAGGNGSLYCVSKILLGAYSILLAKSLWNSQPDSHQILVTTFTPGVTMTDLLSRAIEQGRKFPGGVRVNTTTEGADTGVWLALLPKEELVEKRGKFFHARKEFSFGSLQLIR
ncbi:unnamed protein product [Calypogeia fissa]